MGFDNREVNLILLEEYKGSVHSAASTLLRQERHFQEPNRYASAAVAAAADVTPEEAADKKRREEEASLRLARALQDDWSIHGHPGRAYPGLWKATRDHQARIDTRNVAAQAAALERTKAAATKRQAKRQAKGLAKTLAFEAAIRASEMVSIAFKPPCTSVRASTTSTAFPKPVHGGISCEGCNATPIVGHRFKCMVCPDFDLCSACESNTTHAPDHPLLQLKEDLEQRKIVVHRGVVCDGCGADPIQGPRFSARCVTISIFARVARLKGVTQTRIL